MQLEHERTLSIELLRASEEVDGEHHRVAADAIDGTSGSQGHVERQHRAMRAEPIELRAEAHARHVQLVRVGRVVDAVIQQNHATRSPLR